MPRVSHAPDHEAPTVNTSTEPQRRLVVELNSASASDLAWLQDVEELNKTTLVNRAVQVYRMVIEAQRNGGGLTIDDPKRGGVERIRVV
jgi:hypothetical protein